MFLKARGIGCNDVLSFLKCLVMVLIFQQLIYFFSLAYKLFLLFLVLSLFLYIILDLIIFFIVLPCHFSSLNCLEKKLGCQDVILVGQIFPNHGYEQKHDF